MEIADDIDARGLRCPLPVLRLQVPVGYGLVAEAALKLLLDLGDLLVVRLQRPPVDL